MVPINPNEFFAPIILYTLAWKNKQKPPKKQTNLLPLKNVILYAIYVKMIEFISSL